MATEIKTGDRVQIKHNVSLDGKYGPYRGKIGVVKARGAAWEGVKKIEMVDSGHSLYRVGTSILSKVEDSTEDFLLDNKDTAKDKMEAELRKLEAKVKSLKAKLDFMESEDLDEFHEKDYRAYKILQLAESDISAKDKREIIADLLGDS